MKQKTPVWKVIWTVLWLSMAMPAAYADGLSDLKKGLAKLQGQTALKAVVEAKTWSRNGDGKDAQETVGAASVAIDENSRGLQVSYSKDMLTRLENEERLKEKNDKTKTPTLSALNAVNSSSLRPLLSAAGGLLRRIDKAIFKSEKIDAFNGKPARLLNFELSMDKLNEKDKKYIKKFEGSIDVWIDGDGIPLATKVRESIAGRAFIVVSFESKSEEEWVYSVVGDRLVSLRNEIKNSSGGMGEKNESKTIKTVQIL